VTSRKSAEVDAYLATLEHPMAASVASLRDDFLALDPDLGEHIKWNAPSFVFDGDDRVTFRLHPKGLLQIVLHRGTKIRADAADFRFDDPSGLIVWPAQDRGVITLDDPTDAEAKRSVVLDIVKRWLVAR